MIDGADFIPHIAAMTNTVSDFVEECDRTALNAEISSARLSTILFGSGVTLERLRTGKGVTIRVLHRAQSRLSEFQKSRGLEAA